MKKFSYILITALTVLLLASCLGKDDNKGTPPVVKNNGEEDVQKTDSENTVPDLCGKVFDSALQQKLSNLGYILSVISEYHDTLPAGTVISQTPKAGTVTSEKGVSLELHISAGKKQTAGNDTNKNDASGSSPVQDDGKNEAKPQDITTPGGKGHTTPKWVISPKIDYDLVETFGMTGYSICKKWDNYGIIDMNGKPYGTGAYTKLYFCPEHGLSSPDVTEKTEIAPDLFIMPDCGYESLKKSENIYVYDDSRSRLYLTGYSDGNFRIADITDTEFFKTNSNYIAVLYNCDTDLIMYEDAGMESLDEIFAAENRRMHYGVVNNEFTAVIEFAYDEIRPGNDCYIVKQNGKYGYRGLSGQYYYECIFNEANTAHLGTAWVKYGDKWGTVAF